MRLFTLHFTEAELDFIARLLQQVPYGQVEQAQMLDLLPSMKKQVVQQEAARNPDADSDVG